MNAVSLIGRLTKDVDLRSSASTSVAKFSIAVDRRGAKDGEQQADFINIVCFGKVAENVAKFVGKGRLVGIVGRIQTGSYEKDGRKIYTTEVAASEVQFLDRAPGTDGKTAAPKDEGVPDGFAGITDDDIPF